MKIVKRDTTELRRGLANPGELEPGKPIAQGLNAMELRRLRNYVRYVSSLISTHGRVREEMGPGWACNFEERIVYWRPTFAFPPHEALTPEDVTFLVTHEAGHLNWTGGWNVPSGWSPSKTRAFKTFLNAVEDIRIERLQERDFPGFLAIRKKTNQRYLRHHEGMVKDYSPADQAGFHWLSLEADAPLEVTDAVQRIAAAEWPAVSRMCNLPSTSELAEAVAPIFDRLYQANEDQLEQEANESEGMGGDPDENGNPTPGGRGPTDPNGYPEEPSENPYRSPMGTGQEPLKAEDVLEILRESAKGLGKEHLKRLEEMEKQLKEAAEGAAQAIGGHEAGDQDSDLVNPNGDWFATRDELRAEIGSLARQFKSVLDTNRASNWLEGQRRGSFNSRRARRAVAGDNRIFRKREVIGEHDYTIGLVVDCSGSMNERDDASGTPKKEHALRASVLIAEAAEKAGLRTFIVPFANSCKRVKGSLQKLDDSVRADLGADIGSPTGGTAESWALVAAQDELAKVPRSRRILFVISDGETSGPDLAASLEHEIREMGVPTVALALGLAEGALPHHSTVAHVSHAGELLTLIPRLINEQLMHKGRH